MSLFTSRLMDGSPIRALILGLFTLGLLPLSNAASAAIGKDLNGGYFLLHTLSEDEVHLPLLMLIKTAPPELGAFTKQVSAVASETNAALDRMKSHDPSLTFDVNPLPRAEVETRQAIKDERKQQLVFGTTGKDFGRTLLEAQLEATTYAVNLTQVLAKMETDPDRSRTLLRLSAKWQQCRDQAEKLIRAY